MESKWSLGLLIGLPITLALVLAGVVSTVMLLRYARRASGPYSDATDARVLAIIIALVTLAVIAFAASPLGFYPYEAEYHRWDPVQGTVAEIDKRIVGSGDGMEEKFVVRFEGSQQEYGCEDTRCAVVDEGDRLALSCIRVWQYAGIDGFDCRFVQNDGGAA